MRYILCLSILALCLAGCSSDTVPASSTNANAAKRDVPVNNNVPSNAKDVINKVAAPPPVNQKPAAGTTGN